MHQGVCHLMSLSWTCPLLLRNCRIPFKSGKTLNSFCFFFFFNQTFMEEMTRKQPDVDRVTKTYKRKTVEPTHTPFVEKSHRGSSMFQAAVFCSVVREQQFPSACEDSFHLQKLIGLEPKFFLIFLLTHLFFLILIYFSFILKAE